MLDFEVLMSCMHQSDFSLLEKLNLIGVKTLMVNQCDIDKEEVQIVGVHRKFDTPTRGLSISRNIAIDNCTAEVGLIADDDEIFFSDLADRVSQAYEIVPDADIVIFKMPFKRLGDKKKRLKKYELLKVCSLQISFKINSVKGRLFFDKNLGAGTNNGSCEETKFLMDAYKQGLKIYYLPIEISKMERQGSTWFNGYDKVFFYNRGKTTRYVLGFLPAFFYSLYYVVRKHKRYKKDISFFKALRYSLKGLFTKDINKKYE